ncbi:hypothetical protein [Pedobacter cryotolerans]|uniref:Uncharacterized protein n=1 Tax=Pedobacter cryotolerans TaxID=2571270 RepID=A0A4U1C0E7_9SPHI|nr:hypothetical protein [Pedobacter cryotolerans]TKB97316.1 hypothetical protein FA045_16310 [Pedobacter cryotolerans]
MQELYGSNLIAIIKTINESIYIDDVPNLSDQLIIHTGFTFKIENNKTFELFYDLEKNILLRQVKNNFNLPAVAGVVYKLEKPQNKQYLNKYLRTLVMGISECQDFLELSKPYEYISSENLEHLNIFSFIQLENGIANKVDFPLFKHLQETLLLFNTVFTTKSLFDQSKKNYEDNYERHKDSLKDAEREMDSWNDDYPGWWMGRE